ncbi:MAG: RloB domain-containing protein [Bacteroidetes bacterium]|nr:RloB domain-containing protein [Bacteroidota bacterium]
MAKKGKVSDKRSEEIEDIERPIRYRKYQQFFLIVCEDESTEPYYFENFVDLFPKETLFLKAVGTGLDPLGVTQRSIEEREKLYELRRKEIDFVWVVFDKDDADENEAKIDKFNEAFRLAEEQSINVGYSNEVFELWLLLHLIDIESDVSLPRQLVYEKLQEAINTTNGYEEFEYVHGKKDIIDVVNDIGDEQRATDRANVLFEYHTGKLPIESNPVTRVHILVQELRDWIKYYNWEPEK